MERYNRDSNYYSGGRFDLQNRQRSDSNYRRSHNARDGYYNRTYQDNMDDQFVPNYRSYPQSEESNYYGRYNRSESRYRSEDEPDRRQPPAYSDIRRGYGISDFEGTSDRYNTLSNDEQGNYWQGEQPYYSHNRDRIRTTGFGGSMGESFPHSHRGVPDYGNGNFAQGPGTGMGSSYGGKNYGEGTGYMSGHRGGNFGNNTYGSSSGNYGGYGSMGGGTYGGGRGSTRGDTSHNSNRSISELGGH